MENINEKKQANCYRHGSYISEHFKICMLKGLTEKQSVYIDSWSSCPLCVEEFEESNCPELHESPELIQQNFESCGAGKADLKNAGIENFICSNQKQQTIVNMLFEAPDSYIKQIQQGKCITLFFYGPPGSGKTYFALSMLKIWCSTRAPKPKSFREKFNIQDGNKVVYNEPYDIDLVCYQQGEFVTSDNMCDDMMTQRAKWRGTTKKVVEQHYVKDVPLLVIDEVGRSTTSEKWERDVLFRIIAGRMSNGLSTIITSNFSMEQIQNLGTAFTSRVNSTGCFISFENIPDMRSHLRLYN